METHLEHVQKTLKALRLRLVTKPAWYRETDNENAWYVTNFTHDQMEGNRLACVEQIDKALLSSPRSNSPATSVSAKPAFAPWTADHDGTLRFGDKLHYIGVHGCNNYAREIADAHNATLPAPRSGSEVSWEKESLGKSEPCPANTIPTQKEFLGDLRSFLIELQAHCSFIQWNFGEQQADPINKFWRARIPEWCDVLSPVDAGAQKARRLEIAFTIARKLAGNELHKEAVIRTAVEEAFEEDRAQREQMALTGETDAEFNETTLQIRDGTLKLDTSWLE